MTMRNKASKKYFETLKKIQQDLFDLISRSTECLDTGAELWLEHVLLLPTEEISAKKFLRCLSPQICDVEGKKARKREIPKGGKLYSYSECFD